MNVQFQKSPNGHKAPADALPHKKVIWPMLVRVVADMIMANFAMGAALVTYLLFNLTELSAANSGASISQLLQQYVIDFFSGTPILSGITVVTFYMSGFYTYGLPYRRSKLLILAMNVIGVFIAFGFTYNLLLSPIFTPLPLAAILLAMTYGTGLFLFSRIWSRLWARTINSERKILSKIDRPVRNILVIGGAGYIGSALLPMLLRRGYKVKLMDLAMFGTDPIADLLQHPNLTYIRGDYRQVDIVVESMQEADAVIHLGGLVGDPACAIDENVTVDINVVATKMLVEAAKAVGVQRFIFASTCSVYGASENDSFLTEESSLNPVSLYAKSKIASERVIQRIGNSELRPVILRFGTVYGFSGRIRFDLVVNLLTAMALKDKKITIYGGNQWRPFVHVEDVARALVKAVEAPLYKVANQTFNVGGTQENYTISQVGDIIKKKLPDAELINEEGVTDKRNYRVSFDKIQRVLDFTPHWTVEKGVDQVLKAFRDGRIMDYKNANYSNYKYLNDESNMRLIANFYSWTDEYLTVEDQSTN